MELEKHPDLGKNALARFAQKQRQKRQYAKQAREAALDGRRRYCSEACARAALREQKRDYMRKKRGW